MAQPEARGADDQEVEPRQTQQQDRVEVIRPAAVLEARAATHVLTALRQYASEGHTANHIRTYTLIGDPAALTTTP